ncbi:MAG: type II toxin-antitoxin system death-on-curing family toxin [Clostridia bacterium]|nr:type II toxin-antitoxin system death-on-curing family toxin [Clostridia bacterium]
MMILTVEEVLALHEKMVKRTGGSHGLRDRNLLESAVYSALSTFGDSEAYPTIEEKAARLMFALTNNHAFVDGNKRIGVFVMLMTLRLNGVKMNYTQPELIDFGLSVADGSMDYDKVLTWVSNHKI